jgi:hypothetical protein
VEPRDEAALDSLPVVLIEVITAQVGVQVEVLAESEQKRGRGYR